MPESERAGPTREGEDAQVDPADITSEIDLVGSLPDREQGALRVLQGPELGSIIQIPVTGSMVVGRGREADRVLEDRGLSRRHARFFQLEGHWYVEDLQSRNGVLVEGKRLDGLPRRITHGDRIRMGERVVFVFELHDELSKKASEILYRNAVRDALTGLYNRGYFDDRLKQELAYAFRHESPLSLVLLDLDHFKRVNDEYGHKSGDAVLVAVARVVERAVRSEDVAARYGGEEIVVLARGTSSGGGLALAERLRRHIESLPIRTNDRILRVTASLGVATFVRPGMGDLVAAADEALYVAKSSGRNRCVHADELSTRR